MRKLILPVVYGKPETTKGKERRRSKFFAPDIWAYRQLPKLRLG
jgi:hypothetical protein